MSNDGGFYTIGQVGGNKTHTTWNLVDFHIWDIIGDKYQSILKREIPHLRKHNGGQINQACDYDLEVAMNDTEDYKGIKFCPICLDYENGNYFWSQHEC